ncbi:MAG TPA: hypothetical protein VGK19_00170 [Capsulimonadaceae bacterium]|jgi:hypothetical protein
MKLLLSCLAALIAVSITPAAPLHAPTKLGPSSGLYVQEYWDERSPHFFVGNGSAAPITLHLVAGPKVGARIAPNNMTTQSPDVTIPAGGAVDLPADSFIGTPHVEFRNAADDLIGEHPAPVPPAAGSTTLDGLRLLTGLNGILPARKDIWYSIDSVPLAGQQSGTLTLHINGFQPGWVVVRNTPVAGFPPMKVVSVTSPSQPIKVSKGDWWVDVRSGRSLMQTIVISYQTPALTAPSLAFFDVSIVDAQKVIVPLPRAVLVGAPTLKVPARPVPGPRTLNRPIGGR